MLKLNDIREKCLKYFYLSDGEKKLIKKIQSKSCLELPVLENSNKSRKNQKIRPSTNRSVENKIMLL